MLPRTPPGDCTAPRTSGRECESCRCGGEAQAAAAGAQVCGVLAVARASAPRSSLAGSRAAPAAAAEWKHPAQGGRDLAFGSPISAPVASGLRPEGGGKVSRCPATPRIEAAEVVSCHRRRRSRSRWIASARAPATCSWRSRERAPGGGGAARGRGSRANSAPRLGPSRPAPPRPRPSTNDAARSAPMQICRGLGIH